MKAYLDNAATTKVDEEVKKEIDRCFSEKYGNPGSLHQFGREAEELVEESREKLAKEIKAKPGEIVFLSSGTEANNLALKGVAALQNKKKKIITSKIEHKSVLESCKSLEKEGFDVIYLNVDKNGVVDLEQLKEEIDEDTFLVSIMQANNEIGTIEPIKEIGKICKERDILFHVDAVQSLMKVPIDVKEMKVDLMSFSAHKIHGPKGVGALYVKEGVKLKSLLDGGSQEKGLRASTENVPGVVGFGKAIDVFDDNGIEKLRNYLIEKIEKEIKDVKLNGSREKRLINNVNFSFKGVEGESVVLRLDKKGIAVSTGSACTSHELEPSHVLTAIGLSHERAHGSIRFTLSKYNTKEEVDYVVEKLKNMIKDLREMSPLY